MESVRRHDTLARGPLHSDRQRQCRLLIGQLLPDGSFLPDEAKEPKGRNRLQFQEEKMFT